eukprot:COSAG02_NODE_4625_length_5152_cov_16.021571_1_plen_229_part_00
MEGTVRSNLDPFDQYEDTAVAKAIESVMEGYSTAAASERASLDASADSSSGANDDGRHERGRGPITLDLSVSKDGANFSAGERQLLALARAMLYSRKIIVMDEPTASVDMATDARIQPLIREFFKDMTLLTIAHRINTVISMDRILVLSQGELLEYGRPTMLLQDQGGALSGMVNAMGEAAAAELCATAAATAAVLEAKEGGGPDGSDSAEHAKATAAREARLNQIAP